MGAADAGRPGRLPRLVRQMSSGGPSFSGAARALWKFRWKTYLESLRRGDLRALHYTDMPSWSPLFPLPGVAGPIDVQRAHSIINAYSLAFFDRHLKSRSATRVDVPTRQYPEVLFETRRP